MKYNDKYRYHCGKCELTSPSENSEESAKNLGRQHNKDIHNGWETMESKIIVVKGTHTSIGSSPSTIVLLIVIFLFLSYGCGK